MQQTRDRGALPTFLGCRAYRSVEHVSKLLASVTIAGLLEAAILWTERVKRRFEQSIALSSDPRNE